MPEVTHSSPLLADLRVLIEQARQHVAQAANSTLTMLHWQLGRRIYVEVLAQQRASYGEEILPTLSAKFAEAFPDAQIVATLSQQLGWSHFVEILPLKTPLEREYYAELCRIERWSVRILRERIASQLYLRTAISRKPEAVFQAEISHLRTGG